MQHFPISFAPFLYFSWSFPSISLLFPREFFKEFLPVCANFVHFLSYFSSWNFISIAYNPIAPKSLRSSFPNPWRQGPIAGCSLEGECVAAQPLDAKSFQIEHRVRGIRNEKNLLKK